MRARYDASRPLLLVFLLIACLFGCAALFGWGGDQSYTYWPYRTAVSGTVERVDGTDVVDVSVDSLPTDLRVDAAAAADGVLHAEFASVPTVGRAVSLRCFADEGSRAVDRCVGADLYARYRATAVREAIVPSLALVGFLLVLLTYVVSARQWVQVYRRDRTTGLRQLRVGLVTFAIGTAVALVLVYFAMVRAGQLVSGG